MEILITGGTVFASRFTAEYFSSKGNKVYVLNRGNNPQPKDTVHIQGDRHALGDTLKKYHFDAVLDVTAYNSADVKALHEALGSFDSYVLVSSSAVYPETLPQPFSETQTCGANSIWGAYGTDKLAAEEYVTANIPQGYIIRPPYLYGPMNNLHREAFVFECAENDLPFFVPKDGDMPLQFFHIRDMCRFIEILLEKKPAERIYNVGNSDTVTVTEWVKLCYAVLGKTPDIRHVRDDIFQRKYFPFYDYGYVLDVTRQQQLMPDTAPLAEGLRESCEWFKDHRDAVRRYPMAEFIAENLMQK